MAHTWYVTFEAQKRGVLPKRRSPRATKTFETEAEAKDFARERFEEGLLVYAGTINPYLPRRLITSGQMPMWLEEPQSEQAAKPPGDPAKDK